MTPITDLTTISREWVTLPSSVIWGPYVRMVCLFTTYSPILLTGRRFEAMLYLLYTGEIQFALFNSDPGHDLPAQARAGDWSTGKLPSTSAKSIYRLADKVTNFTSVWCPFDLSGLVQHTDPQGTSQGVCPQQPGPLQYRGGSTFWLLLFASHPLA